MEVNYFVFYLDCRNIVFGGEVGDVEIVGELPAAIRNLTNLTYL